MTYILLYLLLWITPQRLFSKPTRCSSHTQPTFQRPFAPSRTPDYLLHQFFFLLLPHFQYNPRPPLPFLHSPFLGLPRPPTPPRELLRPHPSKAPARVLPPKIPSPTASIQVHPPGSQPALPAPCPRAPRGPSAPPAAASRAALAGAAAKTGTAPLPAELHPPGGRAAAAAVGRGSGSASYLQLGPAGVSAATVPAPHCPGPQRSRANHHPRPPWPGGLPKPPTPARGAFEPSGASGAATSSALLTEETASLPPRLLPPSTRWAGHPPPAQPPAYSQPSAGPAPHARAPGARPPPPAARRLPRTRQRTVAKDPPVALARSRRTRSGRGSRRAGSGCGLPLNLSFIHS